MKKIILGFSLLIILLSCKSNNNQDIIESPGNSCIQDPTFEELFMSPMSVVGDTFLIKVELSNCGEWGGNREILILQRQEDSQIIARLIADTVSCNHIIEKDGYSVLDDSYRNVVIDSTKILNQEEQESLSNMLQRVLKNYLKGWSSDNAGNYYEIRSSDGSFYLNFMDGSIEDANIYIKTRQFIFGKLY